MNLIGYVPGGYPSIKESMEIAEVFVKSGCNYLEISIPPKFPINEAPEIERMMNVAYEKNSNYDDYLNSIKVLKTKYPSITIYLLLFKEVINKIGKQKISIFCEELEITTIICPDLYLSDNNEDYFLSDNINYSFPLRYDMNQIQIDDALKTKGFVYAQAYPLKNQTISKEYTSVANIVKYLRKKGLQAPIYAGVGISDIEKIIEIKKSGVDGFFVGGFLLQDINNLIKLEEKIKLIISVAKL